MADQRFIALDAEKTWARDSDVAGPTTLILGGVHGNELAGIEIVRQLVTGEFEIPLEQGKIILALGNLAAIERGERFTDTNLNREFLVAAADNDPETSYEKRRAQTLLPLLDEATSTLDLHGFRPEDGQPFIITERRGFATARAIGAPYISSGWSTIEAGGTDGYMETQGKIGLCYELGQLADLQRGIPRGQKGVRNFLSHMQLIDAIPQPSYDKPTYVHADHASLAKPGFSWGPGFPYRSFQHLEPGELIAQNGPNLEDAVVAQLGQVIIFPSVVTSPLPGDEMFNLGTIVSPDVSA